MSELLQLTPNGLYCPVGDFYIDPWRPVDKALVTHAHADHAAFGSRSYLTAASGVELLRLRVGAEAKIEGTAFGEDLSIGEARVSFHPAGHILGSSQVRVEHQGEVWVVSGDYKVEHDPCAEPFEAVSCHTFVTECTFGLPVYKWPQSKVVAADIQRWIAENQRAGRASVLLGYSLGKAQRLLSLLSDLEEPVVVHGAVARFLPAYRRAGVELPSTISANEMHARLSLPPVVVAPPSVQRTPWLRRFQPFELALASGWMMVRGTRRRRAVDRGFVLSDHVDWDALCNVIHATGAERVLATHGYTGALVRFLREAGLEADELKTPYGDDLEAEIERAEMAQQAEN
ncbi:MAG: ligase-associated DNA damage response exonuclease [Bdellovibrionales bacterium]|nr:ligase-associated DNA damage response exonuclease [Bdellovibrionales bacterium]